MSTNSKEYRRKYYLKNPNKKREEKIRYYKKYPHKLKEQHSRYMSKYKEREGIKRKTKREKIKLECLTFYSKGTPKCNCCGEHQVEFLTFDHINGGGRKHRSEGKIFFIYVWLKKNNFPDGFQVLCFNCNCAKGFFGICPHNKLV